LQDKSETQGTLKCFLRRAQNEFELNVKKIRNDNGSKFKNLQVEEYLEEGIKHEFSTPYTPHLKWCGREEEQDDNRHGENNVWRVQDA
jgi:hypothetical protein